MHPRPNQAAAEKNMPNITEAEYAAFVKLLKEAGLEVRKTKKTPANLGRTPAYALLQLMQRDPLPPHGGQGQSSRIAREAQRTRR